MQESFKTVVAFYKPIVKLTHKQEVTRLYKKSLRNVFNWAESHDLASEKCLAIRDEFRANMHIAPDSAKAARLIREGKDRNKEMTHPDPYIRNYMPGGSLFMRNSPPPLETVFPDGIPHEMSRRRLNIDMSNVPPEQEYADPCFVDSINKQYWIDK